jgi:hypothetical protein
MVQNAAPELVISGIDAMMEEIARNPAAQSETDRF